MPLPTAKFLARLGLSDVTAEAHAAGRTTYTEFPWTWLRFEPEPPDPGD